MLYGIMVHWSSVQGAVRYRVTLYNPYGGFLSLKLVDKDDCYYSFTNLAPIDNYPYHEYKILVGADGRSGAILDKGETSSGVHYFKTDDYKNLIYL